MMYTAAHPFCSPFVTSYAMFVHEHGTNGPHMHIGRMKDANFHYTLIAVLHESLHIALDNVGEEGASWWLDTQYFRRNWRNLAPARRTHEP